MAWVLRPLDLILAACFGSNGRERLGRGRRRRATAGEESRGGAQGKPAGAGQSRSSGGQNERGFGLGASTRDGELDWVD